jgi:6-phosphogluconolactonase
MGEEMSDILPIPRIDISPTIKDFEIATAQVIVAVINESLQERGQCLIALSGGHTPRSVYRCLGDLLLTQKVNLRRVFIIFVDERMVPPDDPESNYGMVQKELLSRVELLPSQVYRIKGEVNPDVSALEYKKKMNEVLARFAGRCDLTILGIGEDGHTASLFPETQVLRECQSTVRSLFVPHLDSWRVTLTLPVINCSRTVLFLATGKNKADIVGKVIASTRSSENLPATMVRPNSGIIRWMLDVKAASKISNKMKVRFEQREI